MTGLASHIIDAALYPKSGGTLLKGFLSESVVVTLTVTFTTAITIIITSVMTAHTR